MMNLPLADFEFETVTINACGEIIARVRHTARQFREDLANGVSLEMVEVPGGVFLMGSRAGIGYADERPQHSVKVNRFFLGKYAVTQAQWQSIVGRLPDCRGQGARRPVDRVSWSAAGDFCRRLSKKTGRAYRLPGEAEWEYACRARTATPFYCGETLTTDLANYVGEHLYRSEPKGVYRHDTTDVGSFPPNAFGLYDMHGNIWEWCADAWHDDYVGAPPDGSIWQSGKSSTRVLRGGGWHEPPDLCRCAARLRQEAGEAEDFFGLRAACTLYDD
jgi:formylglycine-generating enzyme required for sulfatase activity